MTVKLFLKTENRLEEIKGVTHMAPNPDGFEEYLRRQLMEGSFKLSLSCEEFGYPDIEATLEFLPSEVTLKKI